MIFIIPVGLLLLVSHVIRDAPTIQGRIAHGGRDLSVPQDRPSHTVPIYPDSSYARVQTWEGMAVCAFRSGTVAPATANRTTSRKLKREAHYVRG